MCHCEFAFAQESGTEEDVVLKYRWFRGPRHGFAFKPIADVTSTVRTSRTAPTFHWRHQEDFYIFGKSWQGEFPANQIEELFGRFQKVQIYLQGALFVD